MRTVRIFFAAAVVFALMFSCSRGGSGGSAAGGAAVFNSLADFSGKRIASESGSVFAKFIDRIIPNVDHSYYLTFDDIVAALNADRVDAIALDVPVALYLVAHNKNLAVFPYVVSVDNYGFAVPKGAHICEAGNEVLRGFMESGVIGDAEMYWFAADDGREKSMPRLDHRKDYDGSAGTIRFGCESTLFPMSYASSDGKPLGFDIDIINRIAYELNMKVSVVSMPFGELFPALLAGRLDMVGGSVTITEERSELVDFIGPYFQGGTALVIKKRSMPTRK